ncbi:MAG: antibiotic biosynthesis monooxygenase [Deltaproteobacteria bacterium]|nr:antibiotic biosynthesis monooxygenase [Deltaproteobacteria bacterium]
MSNKEIQVTACLTATTATIETVKEQAQALVEPTRREPGCLTYDLHQAADNPARFMFYECWRSQQDLDTHLLQPHLTSFMKNIQELLAEPVTVSLWNRLKP